MKSQDPAPSRSVAVDLGGTWVRAVVLEDGATQRRVRLAVHRLPELRSFLLMLARGAPRLDAVVVAARGVWTAPERAAVRQTLRGVARRIIVISDAEAAFHGALAARPGVLILSGTGSIVLAHDGAGRWARAGGLGPLLGDDGSAFAIGRAWLRGRDGPGASARARRLARKADAVRRIAALAPAVLSRAQSGDRRARAIVRAAQDDLARLALQAAHHLRLRPPVAVSWAGSVMANAWFRHGVAQALRRAGLAARWTVPAAKPVDGAARLATMLASGRLQEGAGQAAAPSRSTSRGRPRSAGARPTGSRSSRRPYDPGEDESVGRGDAPARAPT